MKKILLIGKTGQLGRELMKDAFSFGFEVSGFEKEELDVTRESEVREHIEHTKPDIVINASAYNLVAKSEESPLSAMELNFLAVSKLARICKEKNITFITYSTDYVFDGRKGEPYEEHDEPNPLQMYGMSKLAGESAAAASYPEGTFIIRTCGLYGGKEGSPDKGNFVLNIMKEAHEKNVIEVSFEQIVNPTYAADLSQATLKLLQAKADAGIYHLANEGECSWYEFTREIFTLSGIDTKVKPVDRGGQSGKMKRPKFSALKNEKGKSLGITLPSWQEGLKSYINFLKK